MILHEFPDLGWLKGQIARGFSNRMGWCGRVLANEGFPSVVIHTRVRECYRPDVKGPFSFFLNVRGTSLCGVDGRTTRVDEDHYFVSNQSQLYTLQVEKGERAGRGGLAGSGGTELSNIHFGERFSESVFHSLVTPVDAILDSGTDQTSVPVQFYNQLHRRDATFNALVRGVLDSADEPALSFEERLTALLVYHLQQHAQIDRIIDRLPPVRKVTRVELYKRLSRAMDVIRSGFCGAVSLDQLAAEACLSKYHFLRLFRKAYGISPYGYVLQLRLEKAMALLAGSNISIGDLAGRLGFDNSQSFSRLFYQRIGVYPSQYRLRAN
ncbi:MAG TPA: helix-turn-helix transcriptional regulator [Puia sp.]|nr:helix-turn-helix transcriptional regulator [Puia sp.]